MIATDPGSVKYVQAWNRQAGHALVGSRQDSEK
jgi:TusA-related sulfurtransferase